MKKRNGKLQLNRETVRHLSELGLRRAAAGGGMDTTNACEEASWCACASVTFCYEETRWDHTCGGVCW
jgi:hypothetical protein